MAHVRYQLLQWINPRDGAAEWDRAYDKLGASGQAKADARVLYLRDQPKHLWREPQAKGLSADRDKDCRDIYEIRFKTNGIQQRPLGFFGPQSGEFTVVLWATHKGSQWAPRDKCRIARERWQDVCNGSAFTSSIEID